MNIIQRICGVGLYYVLLFIVCLIIKRTNDNSNYGKLKKTLIIYNILLSILAFFYVPGENADLLRHFAEMDNFSKLTLSQTINFANTTYVPVYYIYIFIISKTGLYHLLPAITSFVFYNCIFKILLKSSRKYKLSNKSIYRSLLLFMVVGKYVEVISSIRCLLSVALVSSCIYDEMIENKNFIKNIPIYIVASLLHPLSLAYILLRIIYVFIDSEKASVKKLLKAIISLFFLIFLYFNQNQLLVNISEKANGYLVNNVYSYLWEYLLSIISMFFMIYSIIKFNKKIRVSEEIKKYIKFYTILTIIVCLFSVEYSIFTRLQTVLSILFIPVFSMIIEYIEDSNKKYKNYSLLYYIVVFLLIIVTSTRGNLSGLKFF